jgi:hypothetical protein
MASLRDIAMRACLGGLRTYLRQMPLEKGKSRAWDWAKSLLKDDYFRPCVTTTRDGNRMFVRCTEFGERAVLFPRLLERGNRIADAAHVEARRCIRRLRGERRLFHAPGRAAGEAVRAGFVV